MRRSQYGLGSWLATILIIVASDAAADNVSLRQHRAFDLLARKRIATIDYSHHFNGNVTGESTELSFNELRATLRIPAIRWGSGGLVVGVKYSLDAFNVSEVTGQPVEQGFHLLHQVGLPMGLVQVLDDNWYLTIGLHPYLSSDFKQFDADTIFLEGRVEVGWACSAALAFRFGVAAHARFGMYLPFPIVGLAYKGAWYRFDVLLPKILKATLNVSKRFNVEVFSELYPQVWDINQEGLGIRFKYMRIKTGVGVEVRMWKGLHLRVAGGVMPLRILSSYEVEQPGGKEYDLRGDLVPFLDVGIGFGR